MQGEIFHEFFICLEFHIELSNIRFDVVFSSKQDKGAKNKEIYGS